MKTYKQRKNEARDRAVEWQLNFSENTYYWSDLVYWQEYFTKLGKRHGLLTEFRENGII